MIPARQSTARTFMIGPVLDATGVAVTDGVVADFKVSKNGAAPVALDGSATLTHRHTGFYSLALTANDLDTVGTAQVTIDDTVNSCGMLTISVIEEAVYDALFAASANAWAGAAGASIGTANVTQWLGTAAATPTVAGVPEVDVTHYAGNTTDVSTMPASVAAILVDTAEIGVAGAGLTNINLPDQTMNITGDITGNLSGSVGSVTGAVGSVTGAVGSVTGNVGGNVAGSVASVTGNVGGNVTGSVGSVVGAVGSVTGAVGSVTGNVGGNVVGSVASVTGNVTGSVGSLAAQAKTDVNTEVVDALNVDTYAEPGQEAPAATNTLVKKIGYIFKAWRNRKTQTATDFKLFADDATTVDQKATVSDDGTTATIGEIATGP